MTSLQAGTVQPQAARMSDEVRGKRNLGDTHKPQIIASFRDMRARSMQKKEAIVSYANTQNTQT